jgi:hypothetical protein
LSSIYSQVNHNFLPDQALFGEPDVFGVHMQIEQCEIGNQCKNSIDVAGEIRARCYECRFGRIIDIPIDNPAQISYWKPIHRSVEHPVIAAEKLFKKKAKHRAQVAKRLARDRGKVRLAKQAKKSEEKSAESIVKATKNSGRVNKDGDATAVNLIQLDFKLQSTSVDWVVKQAELIKIIQDGKRAGNNIAALVVKNKLGQEIVVLDMADFGKLLARLRDE